MVPKDQADNSTQAAGDSTLPSLVSTLLSPERLPYLYPSLSTHLCPAFHHPWRSLSLPFPFALAASYLTE